MFDFLRTKKRPDEEDARGPAAQGRHVGMHDRNWTAFFHGPFFDVIPAALEKDKDFCTEKDEKAPSPDKAPAFLTRMKEIVLNPVDTDGVYGLTNSELVPLPFDAPVMWEYIVDFLAGTVLVAQATVVMFIAILIDNDSRGVILGNSYQSRWLPIVKALVILYPLVTLIVMCTLTTEYLFRQFMYYRLLSMRVLVDWENKQLWQGWFLYYFMATWILLNVWSLYGVVQFWPRGVRSGADTVQFTTWIVVNLQTMQLVVYYYRLLTSEQRLVSLNSLFERAPAEAHMLLTYTYIIEEKVLAAECHTFGSLTLTTLRLRIANIFSFGHYCQDWNDHGNQGRFNLDRLRSQATNFHLVQKRLEKLRQETLAEAEGQPLAHQGGAQVHVHMNAASAPGGYPTVAAPLYGGPPAPQAMGVGSRFPVINLAQPCPNPALPEDTVPEKPEKDQPNPYTIDDMSGLNFFQRRLRRLSVWAYHNYYGTLHSFYCSFLIHFPTWPYRGDIPYLRTLLVCELIGVLSVALIVVFGVLRATADSRCSVSDLQCQSCLGTQTDGTCPVRYLITRAAATPPPPPL